jgi:AbiJ N-terminal domain 4
MSKFSSRYGYDPKDAKSPILEEAPEWLRIGYINGILEKLIYIDQDTRYKNSEDCPLGVKALLENYCLLLRQEPEAAYYDSWICVDALKGLLKDVPWYAFYDFVELVAKNLREEEIFQFDATWLSKYGVTRYIKQVNALFDEEKIA